MPLLTLMLAGDRPLDVDPATLAKRLRNPDVEVSAPGPERKAHPVEGLAASSTHAAWSWSDQAIAADLQVEGGRLRVRLSCPTMNHVWWPTARPSGKVLVPFGEGLRVDLDQPGPWRRPLRTASCSRSWATGPPWPRRSPPSLPSGSCRGRSMPTCGETGGPPRRWMP